MSIRQFSSDLKIKVNREIPQVKLTLFLTCVIVPGTERYLLSWTQFQAVEIRYNFHFYYDHNPHIIYQLSIIISNTTGVTKFGGGLVYDVIIGPYLLTEQIFLRFLREDFFC